MVIDHSTNQPGNDDTLVCDLIALDPPWTNIIFILRQNRTRIAEDILSGELVDADFSLGLLESIGPERIASAVLRCLKTKQLQAHREFDPTDGMDIVVITAPSPLLS